MAQTKTANAPATKRAPRTLAGTVPATDNARAQIVAQYEAALRLMQEGKYDKAHAAFDKMLASGRGRSERSRPDVQQRVPAAGGEGEEHLCQP